jgi:hypothetical protein
MINMYNQVPSVYTSASRDFQYLSWLINIVLNSVKHNVDDLYDLPSTKADARLVELMAMTLGFKVKRNYDKSQLAALVSILPSVLKCKGTKKAVVMAAKALLITSGTIGEFDENDHCRIVDGTLLEVTLPKDLIDITLFMDLMPYILPAGMSCRVVRRTELLDEYHTYVHHNDVLYANWHDDLEWSTGTAGLYDVGSSAPEFTNYKILNNNPSLDATKPNIGLLDNTIIPALENELTLDSITSTQGEENAQ